MVKYGICLGAVSEQNDLFEKKKCAPEIPPLPLMSKIGPGKTRNKRLHLPVVKTIFNRRSIG